MTPNPALNRTGRFGAAFLSVSARPAGELGTLGLMRVVDHRPLPFASRQFFGLDFTNGVSYLRQVSR
jgi:hypothetical protein